MIAGFLIILLTAGCSFYRYKRIKTERRRVKKRERMEMMDEIQAIENEMVSRGFMKKKEVKKMKKRGKKIEVKMPKKKEKDIDTRKDDNLSTNDDSD